MSKVEELNRLFEKWKVKQKEEAKKAKSKTKKQDENEKYKNTIPILKVDNESFTYDGFVFGEKDETVLYILCESNIGVNAKANDEFWFKGVYRIRDNFLKIPRRIELMQKYLCEEVQNLENTDISFMNINKRGGFGFCDLNILKNYYDRYKDEILSEIKIINPKIIVFCARNEEIYKNLKEKVDAKIIKINMWHPSCRKSDEEYIEEFKNRFKEEVGQNKNKG